MWIYDYYQLSPAVIKFHNHTAMFLINYRFQCADILDYDLIWFDSFDCCWLVVQGIYFVSAFHDFINHIEIETFVVVVVVVIVAAADETIIVDCIFVCTRNSKIARRGATKSNWLSLSLSCIPLHTHVSSVRRLRYRAKFFFFILFALKFAFISGLVILICNLYLCFLLINSFSRRFHFCSTLSGTRAVVSPSINPRILFLTEKCR